MFLDEEMDVDWTLFHDDCFRMTHEQRADAAVHEARDACVVDVYVG